MEKCFECGNSATENHHVIPKSLGGTKTVPLCSSCHMKVHGLDGTRRAESHVENTKRGLDKFRAWDLFTVYQAIYFHDAKNAQQTVDILKSEFDHVISIYQAKRLMKRISEINSEHLQQIFDEHIDPDLSDIWRPEHAVIRKNIWNILVHQYLEENPSLTEQDIKGDTLQFINNQVDLEFRKYKLEQSNLISCSD
jgi:5-methylcytosine-specific restriction endonuclease McrA